MNTERLEQIINNYRYEDNGIIGILQDIQEEDRYLPRETLEYVAKRLDIPLSRVYGIATFYKAFSLKPRGKHIVQVCLGTACHVRGGQRIAETCEKELGIKASQTTSDLMYTLETVNCLGACALGPVIVKDGKYHGQMNLAKVSKILSEDKEKK